MDDRTLGPARYGPCLGVFDVGKGPPRVFSSMKAQRFRRAGRSASVAKAGHERRKADRSDTVGGEQKCSGEAQEGENLFKQRGFLLIRANDHLFSHFSALFLGRRGVSDRTPPVYTHSIGSNSADFLESIAGLAKVPGDMSELSAAGYRVAPAVGIH